MIKEEGGSSCPPFSMAWTAKDLRDPGGGAKTKGERGNNYQLPWRHITLAC